MATSEIGDNTVIQSQGRETIYNVWTFMTDEARDGIKIPLKSVGSRVMAAAVISKRSFARIIKAGKEVDKGTSASFSALGESRQEKEEVAVVDAFVGDVTRRLIHNFHVTQKQRPTLNTVPPLIHENTFFQGRQNIFENNFEEAGVQVFKNTFI
jgi:hypothetical protein